MFNFLKRASVPCSECVERKRIEYQDEDRREQVAIGEWRSSLPQLPASVTPEQMIAYHDAMGAAWASAPIVVKNHIYASELDLKVEQHRQASIDFRKMLCLDRITARLTAPQ